MTIPARPGPPLRVRLPPTSPAVKRFLDNEASGAMLLLTATVAALVWANSPWSAGYQTLWDTVAGIRIGGLHLELTLHDWVNDAAMAIFFLVVGLEINREVTSGELRDRRSIAAPALVRNLALLVVPFVAGYFAWKRRLSARAVAVLVLPAVVLAVLLNVYPFDSDSSTEPLAAMHAVVALWLLVGVAYVGGRWRSDGRRMDFARFTGELAIYFTLLAIGGGVLIGLTVAVLQLVGIDPEPVLETWVLPFAVPGALVVAAWLVEAKQNVVENIAPVLTRVFTPLTIVMLLTLLGALATAGGLGEVDRELLILMDAILVLVVGLLLYSISARDPLAPPGPFDTLQLVLLLAALAVDAVLLTAMLTRIAEFGASPNKFAALGLNLLLLVHLTWAARLSVGFVRGRSAFAPLERWQTRYLPVYGVWAAAVVVVFPPVFAFA